MRFLQACLGGGHRGTRFEDGGFGGLVGVILAGARWSHAGTFCGCEGFRDIGCVIVIPGLFQLFLCSLQFTLGSLESVHRLRAGRAGIDCRLCLFHCLFFLSDRKFGIVDLWADDILKMACCICQVIHGSGDSALSGGNGRKGCQFAEGALCLRVSDLCFGIIHFGENIARIDLVAHSNVDGGHLSAALECQVNFIRSDQGASTTCIDHQVTLPHGSGLHRGGGGFGLAGEVDFGVVGVASRSRHDENYK